MLAKADKLDGTTVVQALVAFAGAAATVGYATWRATNAPAVGR